MKVVCTKDGATGRVVISGDIDSDTAPELDAELQTLLTDGVNDLVLDLAEVTFLSSAGLSVLIGAQRQADRFQVEPGNRIIDRLIALTGLSVLYGEGRPLAAE